MSEQGRIAFEKSYSKIWNITIEQMHKNPNGDYIYKPTQGAYEAWQAATAEANKRIAELESEVALARSNEAHADDQRIKCIRKYKTQVAELQASNKHLREALLASDDLLRKLPNSGGIYGLAIMENNQRVLSTTPAESLQAHDDDVIASITQSLTDPENQPSQFGTVPLSWYENIENKINRIRFNVESIIDSLDGSYEKHAIRKQLKAAIDDEALKEGK